MIVHMREQSDVAVFVRVVELGSFTKAADALEISKAAVSKYVNRLEQRLAARLLHRTTRRLALTEAGQALYGRSAAALAELGEAENDVAQLTGKPRGMLRVTAPTYLGVTVLAPHIQAFRARYPRGHARPRPQRPPGGHRQGALRPRGPHLDDAGLEPGRDAPRALPDGAGRLTRVLPPPRHAEDAGRPDVAPGPRLQHREDAERVEVPRGARAAG